MPNTIRLRRGSTTPSAGSFVEGEPAWDSTNSRLYVKNAAGAMAKVGGGSFTSSTTAPTSPAEGDEWLDENSGILYTYFTDANTSQWVELGTGTVGPQGPAGSVSDGDKGDVTVSSSGTVWTVENSAVAGALSSSRTFALTGDVTGSVSSDLTSGASISTAIAANAVTNADLAQVATATIKGRSTAGTGNVEDLTATQATALLDTFSSGAKGLAPASGGGTANFLRADGAWAAPAPNWHGVVYGAWGNCDPQDLLDHATLNGTVAPTPTNIGTGVARISYFVPPANITVNRIRFLGVGSTTNVYRVAIYNGDTLARLTAELAFSTTANTWGTAGSALALSLTANQLYFIAVSVNATGTTPGVLAMGPTQAATTGQIAVLPKSFPGSLDIDSKYLRGAFAQFTVTTGALPATAATIATQAAWTGGFPAFWLDSNDAA